MERFLSRFPDNKNIREIIEGIAFRERRLGISKVAILANEFRNEGRKRLTEACRGIDTGTTMDRFTEEDIKNLSPYSKTAISEGVAAIAFGSSIPLLEQSLVTGQYDFNDFCARYNLTLDGQAIPFLRAEVDKISLEFLTNENVGKMRGLAKKDKTLTSFFFGENVGLLPASLRDFLEQRGLLSVIQTRIVPVFKELAIHLI